jgi:hypothetical protein
MSSKALSRITVSCICWSGKPLSGVVVALGDSNTGMFRLVSKPSHPMVVNETANASKNKASLHILTLVVTIIT